MQSSETSRQSGDSSACSSLRCEFDRCQVISTQNDRTVGLVESSEHYLSHSHSGNWYSRSAMAGCPLPWRLWHEAENDWFGQAD